MRIALPGLVWICFFSCSDNRVYEDFINLDGRWHQDSVLSYPFVIQDTLQPYNIKVSLTNRNTFPYHNFYFNFALRDGRDTAIVDELHEMILFDPKTGTPMGSGSGNLFEHDYLVLEAFSFPSSGEHRVDLTQFMRQEEMGDIERVGVRVEFHKIE